MKTARLSEVCKLVNGGTPKSGVAEYWGGDVAWLTPAEMGKRTTPYITETARTISRTGLANCSARQVPVGAVILSTRAPIGHLAIPEVPMAFNQGCRGLIPNETLDTKYLYYFLWLSRDALNELGTGATFKELSSGALGNYPIPLPPLEEQRRIVLVLDEAFAAIAQATANAERNLANARELFERQLDFQMEQATREGSLRRLADICDVRDGTHYSPKYVEFGIPFVTQKNIRDDGLSLENTKNISEEDHQNFYKRSNVAFGDIIISMIGANRGMACIVDDSRTFSIKNVGLVKSNERVSMPFLLYFLKSSIAKSYVKAESNGGAQEFIGLTKLRDFPVINLPLDRQQQIATSLDLKKVLSDRLTSSYSNKIANLNALKQSLLHRAFTGELTAKPELALA